MKKTIIYCLISILFLASCKKGKKTNHDVVNYEIIEANSNVEWKGYLPTANNYGTFSLNKDNIITEDGKVTGGSFTIPISSVKVLNLEGELKQQLEHHLLSPDFFNAVLHPNVTFKIKEVRPYTDNEEKEEIEGANYAITGELKLLGTAKDITFPAKITLNDEQLDAEALIRINRLNWGMNYASDPNAGQYILPDVDLHLKLSAKKG